MKKLLNATLIVLSGVIFGNCIQMSESVNEQSAGLNGGFETWKDELPVNWLFYTEKTSGYGKFEIVADSLEFKEGHRALKFIVYSCCENGGWLSPGMTQEFGAKSGEQFKVSFWVKNRGAKFAIKLSSVNATESLSGPALETSESFSEWRFFEFPVVIAEGMKRLRFELNVLQPGVFWIDDVRIEKLQD